MPSSSSPLSGEEAGIGNGAAEKRPPELFPASPAGESDEVKCAAPVLEIAYYTDPLCGWSWGMEPQWRRLRYEYEGRLAWRYCMGGLIPSWETYSDPLNAISRPSQVGPQWFYAQQVSGMPFDGRLWHNDPPASSFPACIAVKAAEMQGKETGERYLRCLREAAMCERRNIARPEVLLDLAAILPPCPRTGAALDMARFREDMESEAAREAFRVDLREVRYRQIGRFPAMILSAGQGRSLLIVGYRPYHVLHAALMQAVPDMRPSRSAPTEEEYQCYWGRLTRREMEEIESWMQGQ